MPTQRLRNLLELAYKSFEFEALSGPIQSAEALLKPETLQRMDEQFKGAFCIVIHDADKDAAIHAYLSGNGIADDSGASIMLLYESVSRRAHSTAFAGAGLGEMAQARPMVDFARNLLPDSAVVLPGMLVLPRLSSPGNPIYIPLAAFSTEADAATQLRRLLSVVAAQVDGASGTLDADGTGRALALMGVPYKRGAMRSPAEHLLIALRMLWDARKDLAAVVSGGLKLAAGRKP
jgi:hypothetical protein